MEVAAEVVEADIKDDNAAGQQQFPWKSTREQVVGQVEVPQAGKIGKRR